MVYRAVTVICSPKEMDPPVSGPQASLCLAFLPGALANTLLRGHRMAGAPLEAMRPCLS